MKGERHEPERDEIYEALTIQALRMRQEVFAYGGMSLDTFDDMYLDGLGEYERRLAKRQGIPLAVPGA